MGDLRQLTPSTILIDVDPDYLAIEDFPVDTGKVLLEFEFSPVKLISNKQFVFSVDFAVSGAHISRELEMSNIFPESEWENTMTEFLSQLALKLMKDTFVVYLSDYKDLQKQLKEFAKDWVKDLFDTLRKEDLVQSSVVTAEVPVKDLYIFFEEDTQIDHAYEYFKKKGLDVATNKRDGALVVRGVDPEDIASIKSYVKSMYDYTEFQLKDAAKVAASGFYEITLKELIKFAGGRDLFLKKFKYSNDLYSFLYDKQKELIEKRLNSYDEIGELSNEKLDDYANSLLEEDPDPDADDGWDKNSRAVLQEDLYYLDIDTPSIKTNYKDARGMSNTLKVDVVDIYIKDHLVIEIEIGTQFHKELISVESNMETSKDKLSHTIESSVIRNIHSMGVTSGLPMSNNFIGLVREFANDLALEVVNELYGALV